ncbi:glycosyltransferase family 2 protein [Fistulina hepatica ATCC 64428]|uniref:Glycosyltransferase family 2 protein n=1 Tax=Fistulina hepatica ATCC 64428 TaxID=1128425 RepID=A0A0D7AQM8_9AGAR|nr:glycosyltransferase family 2 protein [Fistulina hepatica ATCC 64428]
MLDKEKRILVTGGQGFIGSHIAQRLDADGHDVRVVDIRGGDYGSLPKSIEFMQGDLRSADVCRAAMSACTYVFHFAADMGGMGTIHEKNDVLIYKNNQAITLNILEAVLQSSCVERFLFASSACVYPECLQTGGEELDHSLKEDAVWSNPPPKPQGLYGMEKLVGELLLSHTDKLDVRIARFHNVFGPRGAWCNGREKAPAALLRKACVAKWLATHSPSTPAPFSFEIWGTGKQRRSFLYIDDCVDGVLKLMNLPPPSTESVKDLIVNIGSETAVTMTELAHMALDVMSVDRAAVLFEYDTAKPAGVASRNSQNDKVQRLLGWTSTTSLAEGMRRTGSWIMEQLEKRLSRSRLLDLGAPEPTLIKFAILLPVTSRGWMANIHKEFLDISRRREVPFGVGCVAFTDTTFPGMPTFPVVSRKHMDIFYGNVVPDIFVNQDGDPFLFQLYHRFGCSVMLSSCHLSNAVGGSTDARYAKIHAPTWTFDILDRATKCLEVSLAENLASPSVGHTLTSRLLTIDVVVPSYRVDMRYLERILDLKPSPTASTMFIIIVDNPLAASLGGLRAKYEHRTDVRIRVNQQNMGASASRNRGLAESAAEWVLFLDDDVMPEPDLLVNLEKSARKYPQVAGFVGDTRFPDADTIFKAAVHFAGVTYFWSIAASCANFADDIPWGVTACLAARRNVKDGIKFNLAFPFTGGGEDIMYCVEKRDFSKAIGGAGFSAAPDVVATHPWWNNGRRSYIRFYMWSVGDGALIKLLPQHSYRDIAPNGAEFLLMSTVFLAFSILRASLEGIVLCTKAVFSIVLSNIIFDLYRHLWRRQEGTYHSSRPITITGCWIVLAIVEATFIRMFSEAGRTIGILQRGEFLLLGKRFDWFTGRLPEGPSNERRGNLFKAILILAFFAFSVMQGYL